VGALCVRYCAIPAVEEANVEYGRGGDEDESAEANARCVEEGEAVFGHVDGAAEAFGSREKMLLRLVDAEQLLHRRVTMVVPRKGERFE
jgi:hypothetical protein